MRALDRKRSGRETGVIKVDIGEVLTALIEYSVSSDYMPEELDGSDVTKVEYNSTTDELTIHYEHDFEDEDVE